MRAWLSWLLFLSFFAKPVKYQVIRRALRVGDLLCSMAPLGWDRDDVNSKTFPSPVICVPVLLPVLYRAHNVGGNNGCVNSRGGCWQLPTLAHFCF